MMNATTPAKNVSAERYVVWDTRLGEASSSHKSLRLAEKRARLQNDAERALLPSQFDTNGDCRSCDYHASWHAFRQGSAICPKDSDPR